MRNRWIRLSGSAVAVCGIAALLAGSPQQTVPVLAAVSTQLQWVPCPAEAKAGPASCASLSVPMDYAHPEGRQIQLTVSRIPASGHRLGVLFGNPGGPGADALDMWQLFNGRMPARVHEEFDEIAVQPRGLRWSTPLRCGAPVGPSPAGLVGSTLGIPTGSERAGLDCPYDVD